MIKKQRAVCLAVFAIYLLVLLNLTIFRFDFYYEERQLNLTLFTGLIRIFQRRGIGEFLRLFLGNIGWFVPLGFLLPLLSKRKGFLFTAGAGLMLSFMIEAIQFIFYKGVAELDDLLLNVLGTALGYLFYKTAQRLGLCKLCSLSDKMPEARESTYPS